MKDNIKINLNTIKESDKINYNQKMNQKENIENIRNEITPLVSKITLKVLKK